MAADEHLSSDAEGSERQRRSLPEVFASVQVPRSGSWFKQLLAFTGPGYIISVGYMDPGNWATAIAGGSKFGYTLLSVVLISNLMAMLLQALAARLGPAQAHFPASRAVKKP